MAQELGRMQEVQPAGSACFVHGFRGRLWAYLSQVYTGVYGQQMGDVRAPGLPSKTFRPNLAPNQSPGLARPPPAPHLLQKEGRLREGFL